MQVFRLMGMPDKVIAFDGLPEDYLKGLEMCDCTKLGRAWRDFIGQVERTIDVKPEIDPLTRRMITFPSVKEKAPFAYLLDRELNHDKERWQEIVEYVKKNAPVNWEQTMYDGNKTIVRLPDDIERLAKPLAKDAHSELDLEPEDVIVVPLPKLNEIEKPVFVQQPKEEKEGIKCKDCEKVFEDKRGIRMHRMKKHPEPVAA